MKPFRVEMLTPERTFFDGEAESLIIETSDGQLGILAGHAPIAIGLQPASVVLKVAGGKERIAAHGEGFVVVRPDKTVILCQTMEWPEEIELARVKRAIDEHEQKLKNARNDIEIGLSKATIARAFARLKVLQKK
ncbi:MAG: ATP synthase F1 subunit epsilon [Clostridiaceae bacterium]|jgi:F-type H+-transporting ATPase subunit epsilon|nr:ATP synthase F1 subunit epsilon [Clostridiaceae bacterium]